MKSNILKRGFLSLVATQFFGAMNDNVLKGILTFMVIDGAWKGDEEHPYLERAEGEEAAGEDECECAERMNTR